MTTLFVNLLGGYRLFLGKTPLSLKTQKAKGLLAFLVMHQNVPLTRAQLAVLLWPEQSTEKGLHSLRQALTTLRKAIPNFEQICLINRAQIVCVGSKQLRVDVHQFEMAFEGAGETAVSLYKGPFLDGFYINDSVQFETWLLNIRERLQTQMLTLLERLVEAAEKQNKRDTCKKYLRQLIDIDPWHEPAHQRLMRLYAASGELNRAIALFNSLSDRLRADLALEPMESSVKLLDKIKAARRYQGRRRLPILLSNFVGREEEKQKVEILFNKENARVVTIQGPGGVGKSSLAIELARHLENRFLNGVIYVPLASLQDYRLISREVAAAVEFKAQHNNNFEKQLIEFLSNREMLLLLDNFEHLLEGRQFVVDLLNGTADIALLITSQASLNLQQEHRLMLGGLAYPTDLNANPDGPSFESYRLFVTQAKKIKPQFDPEVYEAEILQICQLLQGMPLGLELAAAQVDQQSVADLLGAIVNNFKSLENSWGDRPERHHSLQAAFLHAWNQLSNELQTLLGKLAVFRGGFSAEDAKVVAQAERPQLIQLLNKSLLQLADNESSRFYLHPVVQQFAVEAVASSIYLLALDRHAEAYLSLVKRFQDNGGYAIENLEETTRRLNWELDNIRQGWKTAVLNKKIKMLSPALTSVSKLYASQSWFREGASLFEWTISELASTFKKSRAEQEQIFWGHLHGFASAMFLYLSEVQKAQTLAQQSIDILTPLSASDETAYAWNMLGISLLYQGDFWKAIAAFETSLEAFEKSKNLGQKLGTLINLGSAYQRVGEYDKGLAALMEAQEIAEQTGDLRGSTHLLNNIGGILFSIGRFNEAKDYFERCNQLCEETDYPMVQAGALLNLAELQLQTESIETETLQPYLEKALLLSQTIGDKQKEARAYKLFADYWLGLGAHAEAHEALQKGLTIVWKVQAMPTLFELLLGFATYYLESGQRGRATSCLAILSTEDSVPKHIATQAKALVDKNLIEASGHLVLDNVVHQILEI